MAKLVRYTARMLLLAVSLLLFTFSLLSGAEQYGGGWMGILKNSPNALPWLLLLILVYVAWRWELLGGGLILAFGIMAVFFFHLLEQGLVPFLIVGFLPMALGGLFVWAGFLNAGREN